MLKEKEKLLKVYVCVYGSHSPAPSGSPAWEAGALTRRLQLSAFPEIRGVRFTWATFKFTPVHNVLLRFPGWTTCLLETVCNGVQRGLRYVSLVWWVCQKCQPNQQQHVYKPRGIKETARTMGPSEVVYNCVRCSSQQLKILKDMFVVRVL